MDNLTKNLKNFLRDLTVRDIESFDDIRFLISAEDEYYRLCLDYKYVGLVKDANEFAEYVASLIRQHKLNLYSVKHLFN